MVESLKIITNNARNSGGAIADPKLFWVVYICIYTLRPTWNVIWLHQAFVFKLPALTWSCRQHLGRQLWVRIGAIIADIRTCFQAMNRF